MSLGSMEATGQAASGEDERKALLLACDTTCREIAKASSAMPFRGTISLAFVYHTRRESSSRRSRRAVAVPSTTATVALLTLTGTEVDMYQERAIMRKHGVSDELTQNDIRKVNFFLDIDRRADAGRHTADGPL